MKKAAATTARKTPKTSQRQPPSQVLRGRPLTPVVQNTNKTSSSTAKLTEQTGTSLRKASTPTHDKPTRTQSPNVSHIMPTEIPSFDQCKQATAGKPDSKTLTDSDKEKLADQLDFEYTHYLQTMFRRKLAEAEASEVDDTLTALQKRITENQNILEKTTTRLKNVNFNREVETLHKLRNPNYGRVLETLDNVNCKEYLETINKRMEQNQNQLRMKNVELPQGGGNELLQIIKETLAACEKLKADNNLEVPKIVGDIKASNKSTSETLSRCLVMVPEVEDLILDKATSEMYAKHAD